MSTRVRVGAFAAALVVVFGAAFGIGRLFEDDGPGHYALRLTTTEAQLAAGGPTLPIRFQVVGPDGSVQKRFTTNHERKLHLVMVSHDLSEYRHLHPVMATDGTWSVEAPVTRGRWRIYADFKPAGGSPRVAHRDVFVGEAGEYMEMTQEGESRDGHTEDGYGVGVSGDLVAGTSSTITFTLKDENVRPVTDLEPYLGAYGHLVVIKDKGLDYVHAHAEPGPTGPTLTFHVEAPKVGQYHLFLDFKRGGVVHTFTAILIAGKGAAGTHNMEGMDHGDH